MEPVDRTTIFVCFVGGSENTNKNKHLFFEGGMEKTSLFLLCLFMVWWPGGLVAWWPDGLVAWCHQTTEPKNMFMCLFNGLVAWWPGGLMAW